MVAISGNFALEAAVRLSCQRLFRLSSFCAERRCYYSSSSHPVKYISKKSREKNGGANDVGSSCGISRLPSSDLGNRFNGLESNVMRDGSSDQRNPRSFSHMEPQTDDLGSVEEELDVNLPSEDDEYIEHSDEMVKNVNAILDTTPVIEHRQVVEKMAVHLLASRAFTASELKRKLHGKRLSVDIVDAVVSDFQCRGLINDSLFAEAYCESRWSSSSWGPGKIKQGLLRKGVSLGDADKAIKGFFNKGQDDDLQNGFSRACMDELYVEASKRWQRSIGVPAETRKSRIVRWLQYRGFNWGVVGYILKKLDSEKNPL